MRLAMTSSTQKHFGHTNTEESRASKTVVNECSPHWYMPLKLRGVS